MTKQILRHPVRLRDNAITIWSAGVAAVRGDRLVDQWVAATGDRLTIKGHEFSTAGHARFVVVGAGKAAASVAAALESKLCEAFPRMPIVGWVNVPDNVTENNRFIYLHHARPPGVNAPTERTVDGTRRMLRLLKSLTPSDFCLCIITGGASALLSLPAGDVTLADKVAVTQLLSAAGASIQQLNTVRKQLSDVKGGRLANQCRAGQFVTLLISDVLGDPLDVIGSGPTFPDESTPASALAILDELRLTDAAPATVMKHLRQAAVRFTPLPSSRADHIVLANNDSAVAAARQAAVGLGYDCDVLPLFPPGATAEETALILVDHIRGCQTPPALRCVLSGGEPVVRLVPPEERGTGGRNQQLALAALQALAETPRGTLPDDFVLLSGGTDGEDGPTDAAGALVWPELVDQWRPNPTQLDRWLGRNDAYDFFSSCRGLLTTGPTKTNVCDLRIVLTRHDNVKSCQHGSSSFRLPLPGPGRGR